MHSQAKPKIQKTTLYRMLALLKPHSGLVLFGMIGLAGGSIINLLLPELARRVINTNYFLYLLEHPFWVGFCLAVVFALQGIFFYLRAYFLGLVGQRIAAILRGQLFESLVDKQIIFFDSSRSGDLVTRITADTQLIQDALSIKLSVFIRYAFQVIVGAAAMVFIAPRLALWVLLLVPVIVLLSVTFGKKLKAASKLQQAELAKTAAIAEEVFGGIRVVKAFNREFAEVTRFQDANMHTLAAGMSRTAISAFFSSFVSFLLNVFLVAILIKGAILVADQNLAAGDLTAFSLYGAIVAVSFAFVASGFTEFIHALGAAERIFELKDIKSNKQSSENIPEQSQTRISQISSSVRELISFGKVFFSYPSREDVPVLKNISFSVAAGETAAIVGTSGAGKSTIVSLILGFYSGYQGAISFAGQNLKDLDIHDLRDKVSLVPQDPQLFSLSLHENITFGKPNATQEQVEEVCRKAQILDFIKSLPEGFATQIGERGVKLSGGQKQRIAIARALLRNPQLLILDEATSSLDSESEFAIQQAIELFSKQCTVLVIAHRLATVKNANKVLVLDKGEIVQTGTHEELSKITGLYQQLVQRQELIN